MKISSSFICCLSQLPYYSPICIHYTTVYTHGIRIENIKIDIFGRKYFPSFSCALDIFEGGIEMFLVEQKPDELYIIRQIE